MMILSIIILIISIVFHELGHSITAHCLGDPTAKQQGRLSLNPFVHLDLFGSFVLPVVLWIFNVGFLFGWAKPVVVNPVFFKSKRYGIVWVALSGPLVNLLLMFVAIWIWKLGSSVMIVNFAQQLYQINIVLFIFNLIPIPPLDGSRVVAGFMPQFIRFYWEKLDQYGVFIIVLFIMANGVDFILSYFIPLLSNFILF